MDEYIRQIRNYIVQMIPDEYEVSITENLKNNGVLLHGICIKAPGDVIAPIIYAENYYNNGFTAQEAAQGIINKYYEEKEKEAKKRYSDTFSSRPYCRNVFNDRLRKK